jgi:hypothetical protein
MSSQKVRLMRKCHFEEKIDDYLLEKLEEAEREAFQEHLFNCPSCFARTSDREEILHVIKTNPSLLTEPEGVPEKTRPFFGLRLWLASFKPREWALAGLTACVSLAVLALLLTRPSDSPVFLLEDDTAVRGNAVTLISPVIDVGGIPSFFEWRVVGENTLYDLTLSNHTVLWKTTTRENRVVLPPEIRAKMKAGESYSWQIKAFTAEGTLIAVSSRVRFTVARPD